MLTKKQEYKAGIECTEPIIATIAKSFTLTIINPITIFFFMFISVKVVPGRIAVPHLVSLIASSMISLGSLTTFSIVAFFARNVRKTLGDKQLHYATYVTGIAFVILGLYFSFDLIRQILKYFHWL
jgi:threonine/homoserine/homoserine lactone efflux protein